MLFQLICMVCEWSAVFKCCKVSVFHGIDAAYRCMHRSLRKKKRCKKKSECLERVKLSLIHAIVQLISV